MQNPREITILFKYIQIVLNGFQNDNWGYPHDFGHLQVKRHIWPPPGLQGRARPENMPQFQAVPSCRDDLLDTPNVAGKKRTYSPLKTTMNIYEPTEIGWFQLLLSHLPLQWSSSPSIVMPALDEIWNWCWSVAVIEVDLHGKHLTRS